jgi:CRISPR-associated protein Cas2
MMVLVTYDVKTEDKYGKARLRNVAKACKDYGQRVQYSVFECLLEPAQWVKLKQRLLSIISIRKDSLRFYFLGANWKKRVEHIGAKETYDPDGALIF